MEEDVCRGRAVAQDELAGKLDLLRGRVKEARRCVLVSGEVKGGLLVDIHGASQLVAEIAELALQHLVLGLLGRRTEEGRRGRVGEVGGGGSAGGSVELLVERVGLLQRISACLRRLLLRLPM